MSNEGYDGGRSGFFDKDGHAIPMEEWGRLAKDPHYKFVGFDSNARFRVSTVWAGENLATNRLRSPPLIFESIVYEGRGPLKVEIERYASVSDALSGHVSLVAKYLSLVESLAALAMTARTDDMTAFTASAVQRASESGLWARRRLTPRPRSR